MDLFSRKKKNVSCLELIRMINKEKIKPEELFKLDKSTVKLALLCANPWQVTPMLTSLYEGWIDSDLLDLYFDNLRFLFERHLKILGDRSLALPIFIALCCLKKLI